MYEKELNIAKEAALKAGNFLKRREGIHVDAAEGKDIKLSSDKRSEEIIINILKTTGIPILSEECGQLGGDPDEFLWIIDPLDGTANYWKGVGELACVSVALWRKNEPALGVVYRFEADELYYGAVGEGAFLNGRPIKTSSVSHTGDAVLATGFPVKGDYGTESLSAFVKQAQDFKKVRMLGAAAIMGAFVAAGKFDAYMEDGIMLWDIAGASAIVLAAGGKTDITMLGDYRCTCKCFSGAALMEDYNAKSL